MCEGGVEGLHAAPAAHTAHGGGQGPQHIRGAHTQAGAQLSLAQAGKADINWPLQRPQ